MPSRVFTILLLLGLVGPGGAALAGCVRTAECDELVLCPSDEAGVAQVCLDFVCTSSCSSDDVCQGEQMCTSCAALERCSSDANLALSVCVAPPAVQ
ncbi:MAG: hypothetical protein AAGI01_03000 [Myxococcota bacterium]